MDQKGLFEIKDIDSVGRMDGKYRRSWVEESYGAAPGLKEHLGASVSGRKIKWLAGLVLVSFLFILAKVFYLQVLEGDYYHALAENNRVRLRSIPSERGVIFDRAGKPLVENVPSFLLSIVPQNLPAEAVARKKVINQVAELSGVPKEKIENSLVKYKNYSYESLTIKENLDYDTALNLYVKNANLPGLLIEKSTKRHYLLEDAFSLSHLLGYLGKLNDEEVKNLRSSGYLLNDYIGKIGLEKVYENELRGKYGIKKVEMDAGGHEQRVLSEEPPKPGNNFYLSLDLEAQKKLEELIQNQLARLGKKRAAAVAINPQNGAILALVSWPSFDANKFSGGIDAESFQKYINDSDHPLFNRVIGGTYPSGSTVKMGVAAAALEEGLINAGTSFLSAGGLQVDRWFFRDWQAGGHGITNVRKAIALSVNTFFYYIGGGYGDFIGLGVEKLTQYMRYFNLAQKTGIDLIGESAGFLPSKSWKEETKNDRWYIGDTYNLSIGQGDLLVTPLQVAVWTAAVANGGIIYQPRLADRFYNPNTKKEEKVQPKILNQNFISKYNMNIVKEGMGDCVRVGGCQYMQSLPFTSGGKTGTAQWSSAKDDHAWYTAFAPFNTPQIVITVLVEEGEEGFAASMPIARDFLAWWGKKYLR